MRRYRCYRYGGCGWEGMLPAMPNDLVIDQCHELQLERERMPHPVRRRLILWVVIGLASIALAAAGVKLYRTFAATSLLPETSRTVALGFSDFGRPLPKNHPFLQQDGEGAAIATANAALSSDGAPLALRENCAWGEPGRNPYSGTVRQALTAARLPPDVVTLLERKIQDHEVSDRLEIRNDQIRAVQGKATFDPWAIKMTYGKTLCLNSRVNFIPGHVELADLYQAADAHGVTHYVMIPHVCRNISVIQAGEKPWAFRVPRNGHTAPEPETWTLVIGGLALLGWLTGRSRGCSAAWPASAMRREAAVP